MNIKLRKYKKHLINISISILSVIVLLISIEFLLKYLGIGDPVIYKSSNYYGYYHKTNTSIKRFKNIIYFDDLGNRFLPEYEKENDDLIFVGDSVTYGGSSISTENLFSYKVSKKLNKKFVNISANGWGIPNMINFIDFNKISKNKTFVFILIEDSFLRNLRRHEQNFFFVREPKYALNEFFHRILSIIVEQSYFQDAKVDEESLKFNLKDNLKIMQYSINKLVEFNEKVKAANGKVIIIYSPNDKDFKYFISKNEKYNLNLKNKYLNILIKKGVQVNDLMDFITEKNKHNFRNFYSDTIHLNERGHVMYSEIILKILEENEIY